MEHNTVTLPKKVVEKVIDASEAFLALHDELEDFLISQQPALIKKLRQARREHLAGKTRPFVPHS